MSVTGPSAPPTAAGHEGSPAPFARALVASDASAASDGALRLAAALQRRDGTAISVISVVQPTTYPAPVNDLAVPPSLQPTAEEEAIAARRAAVEDQCARNTVPAPTDIFVECSVPLSGILFHATARKADLIVLGLGRHNVVDRFFGTETALHAVRESDVATLAVPGTMTSLPRHAVVGTDFDASSLAAARAAARLVGPHGHLTLVHVTPSADPLPAMLADWPPAIASRMDEAFGRMIAALHLPATMDVDTLPLSGNVGKELVACAERLHAGLIAVGRHSRTLMERVVLGSATTRVVRTAACAVIVVPRDA
ncbi:MAG: universal stress protein [Gemmatimonadaceae bacterium]|nr:universal stress protein [Gemmatimonadaceae bacterium]